MTKRPPKPLPPPTMRQREIAGKAARALLAAIADPSTMGEESHAHVDLASPRRGEWWTTWANLPGFTRVNNRYYIHNSLPGWRYRRHEIKSEMIPDLQRLSATGERPTEETS